MKTSHKLLAAVLLTIFFAILSCPLEAQPVPKYNTTTFEKRKPDGPRLGATIVLGESLYAKKLEADGMGRLLSQFGWHFEYQVVPKGGGPAFVIEFIPLVAGVEYGTLIPSATLALGIRMPNGIEFGLGPNVMIGGKNVFNTSLVIGVGKTFDYQGVSIPLNLAWSTGPMGNRLTFLIGYAID